eukprot:scaffold2858_cov51-Phaeocystis_antarctica.AAC.2
MKVLPALLWRRMGATTDHRGPVADRAGRVVRLPASECTSSIAVVNLHRLRRLFTDADADAAAASGTAGGGDGAAAARDVRRDEARRDGTPLPTGVIVAAPWRVT